MDLSGKFTKRKPNICSIVYLLVSWCDISYVFNEHKYFGRCTSLVEYELGRLKFNKFNFPTFFFAN